MGFKRQCLGYYSSLGVLWFSVVGFFPHSVPKHQNQDGTCVGLDAWAEGKICSCRPWLLQNGVGSDGW